MSDSLKNKNKFTLAAILLVNFALFFGLLATNAIIFSDMLATTKEWRSLVPAGLAVLVAGVLGDQLSPNTKARLVFWRWNNPLPAREAFSRLGPEDARCDMEALAKLTGPFPTEERAQNQAWFKLYQTVKNDPAVLDVHRSFLLFRDASAMSALITIPLTGVALWMVDPKSSALLLGGILVAEYLLFRRAAFTAGCRFVTTVLAIKSSEA